MLRPLLHSAIRQQEKHLGAPLDYLREIADSSSGAFVKLALLAPLGTHRRHLPPVAWHLARVTATFAEDCGTCAQIAITLARRDGVPADLLRAVIAGDDAALTPELRNLYLYTRAVAAREDDASLRDALRAHYGPDALIELALAIATSRLIPTLKRALGHATSCSLLHFDLLEPAAPPPRLYARVSH